MRPLNAPFIELNQSRHSHHKNNVASKDYAHLQKSSKSYTNTNPHLNQKPNSGSAINYQIPQPHLANTFIGQPQFHNPHHNVVMLPTSHTIVNGNFVHPSQFKAPYTN